MSQTYSVLDTETTGLSPKNNKIIEIAIVNIKEGRIINKYSTLVNPAIPISQFITSYTGISNNHLKAAPSFFDISYQISDLIENTTLVAHNALFDLSFLNYEYKRVSLNLKCDYLCTINLCKRLYPTLKKRNLDSVCRFFNINIQNRHRALGDAIATAKVLIKMQKDNQGIWKTVDKSLRKSYYKS